MWWPWLDIFNDLALCLLFTTLTIFLLYTSKNIFYTIFYFFLFTLFVGLTLCFCQLELFTGFLWTIECVVFFALLLLLFFFKTTGSTTKIWQTTYTFFYSFLALFIFLYVYYISNITSNLVLSTILNNNDLYDNYYEALTNTNINDFTGFLISYYTYNSLELIIVGFIILITSLVCVNLNKLIFKLKIQNIREFLTIFNFFKNHVTFSMMRQQNLTTQAFAPTTTRIFKKKNIE